MKTDEIITEKDKIYCRSREREILYRYMQDDVVTAYIKNSFGIAFLIKGKIKGFAFVYLNYPFYTGWYNLEQINIGDFFKAFGNAREEEKVIVDEVLLKKIKAKQMLIELNTENKQNGF